ncbi:hypothetical protein Naga_101795g2 [Nannochloropsis gaditana]|uniref:Uncharacterized protein n=1 Tax=Nannochloropsis gaditana TaxID=72520 RepID=W7TAU0_9STRA|nr:hypothetical protein Naga_101795g2 [Nannochloropsis gaditana]
MSSLPVIPPLPPPLPPPPCPTLLQAATTMSLAFLGTARPVNASRGAEPMVMESFPLAPACPTLFPGPSTQARSRGGNVSGLAYARTSTSPTCETTGPLLGFFITLSLSALCFWRLVVFTSVALRYRWFPLPPPGPYADTERTVLLAGQRGSSRPPSRPQPPQTLSRKLVFHFALFLAVTVDLPR